MLWEMLYHFSRLPLILCVEIEKKRKMKGKKREIETFGGFPLQHHHFTLDVYRMYTRC